MKKKNRAFILFKMFFYHKIKTTYAESYITFLSFLLRASILLRLNNFKNSRYKLNNEKNYNYKMLIIV